jgi:predicted enzyme related to lactoylglutathione lyase
MVDLSVLESAAPLFPCRDLARAIEYYQDVLGFQPRFINMGGGRLPVFAILARDGVELHLVSVRNRVMNRRDRLVPGSASCFFRVRRIEDLLDRCEAHGADLVHEDFSSGKYGLKTFTIADLEGNEVTFAEETS